MLYLCKPNNTTLWAYMNFLTFLILRHYGNPHYILSSTYRHARVTWRVSILNSFSCVFLVIATFVARLLGVDSIPPCRSYTVCIIYMYVYMLCDCYVKVLFCYICNAIKCDLVMNSSNLHFTCTFSNLYFNSL